MTLVEVTLEKVNHGKLKFTMVNGTTSVTPNSKFTIVNLALVSCLDHSGKKKVDLTPDKNLVTKKKRGGYISCLSKPCLFCCQFVISLDKCSNYNTFVDSYFINMKFIFPLIHACLSEHGFQQR